MPDSKNASVFPPLAANVVHVWIVALDVPDPSPHNLSRVEVDRSLRYRFERDRRHYVTCRTALRRLLGRYLALPPREVRFDYSPKGKPELSPEQNPPASHPPCHPEGSREPALSSSKGTLCSPPSSNTGTLDIRFNVSHSGELALIAVGLKSRLGVDIEKIRPEVDIASLSQRYFSERERSSLAAMSGDVRERAFFACWTRKEAFLKATGFGLSGSLSGFTVSTQPEQPARIEAIDGTPQAANSWTLADISVPAGYRAAVAIEAQESSILVHSYIS